MALVAVAAGIGCSAEELGRPAPEGERFALSPCAKYFSPAAACGFVAIVGGGIPAACTSGAALPWALGAFDACLGYYGLSDIGEFWARARECGLTWAPPPTDDGPITGEEAACTHDDCDPTTECIGILNNRSYELCFGIDDLGNEVCTTWLCGDAWSDACETALENCVRKTTELWLEDKLDEMFGEPSEEATPSPELLGCTPSYDFDHDGQASGADVGALMRLAIAAAPLADLDGDGQADERDRDFLVHDILDMPYGDADENGQFDSQDLVLVFAAGLYGTGEEATWAEGDWDGNGIADSHDIVLAFTDGCYDQGPDCV